MKPSNIIIVVTILVFSCSKIKAQQVDAGFEVQEIAKLAEVYRSLNNLSFDISYTYADSASPAVIQEQLTGSYKIMGENYWAIIDSIEYLQGAQYRLVVYHYDSLISVADKVIYPDILQLPILDSTFRATNVTQITCSDSNDSTRVLVARFVDTSYYTKYVMTFDQQTYLIKEIEYYVREQGDSSGGSGIQIIKMDLTNYSMNPIKPEFFDESRFIIRKGNQFFANKNFEGYRLLVNVAGVDQPQAVEEL